MDRRNYRLCLIAVIMAVVVSGIFYYRFIQQKGMIAKGAAFVWQETTGSGCA